MKLWRKARAWFWHRLGVSARCRFTWRIEKYRGQAAVDARQPYEVLERGPNLMLNVGIGEVLDLAIGVAGNVFNKTNSRIRAGTGTTAADPTDTDIQAHLATATADSVARTDQTVLVKATFAAGVGTGTWQEVVWDNKTGGTEALCRLVYNMGTKAAGDIWITNLSWTMS